ncbi:MAG: Clp1/GlmU family protein [Candidatus Helarchaeota archaeon]
MQLELQAGQGIEVQGPIKLHVIEGTLSLLGGLVTSDTDIIIQAGKLSPFMVEEDSKIELNGTNIEYKVVDERLIPYDRQSLALKLKSLPTPLKIMVLGDVDSGKTTIICYLANYFFNLGKKVAVIDLDMGQQDIGPPSTIALGLLEHTIYQLGDIPLNRMYFIGKTNPKGRMVQTITGAHELVDAALYELKADIILIDTTGWVSGGAARAYKTAKIRNLKPNLLIAMQSSDEIAHILEPFELHIEIEHLPVYPYILKRSLSTRKFLRESKFNTYFSNGLSRLFNLNQIKIENSFFRSGTIMDQNDLLFTEKTLACDFIYAEKASDIVFLVKKPAAVYKSENISLLKNYFGISEFRVVSKGDEIGLVVGLLDKKLRTLGIGIIENIIYEENKIRLFTPVKKAIKILQFGSLKISKTGQELSDLKNFF